MPSSCQSSSSSRRAARLSPLLTRVPRQLGYTAYLDCNETEVFTCLDMAEANHCDVVPFNRVEYPSRGEVRYRVLSFLLDKT